MLADIALILVAAKLEAELFERVKVPAVVGVAVIGVAAPFVLGSAAGLGFGESGNTALFVGAALTATSVVVLAFAFMLAFAWAAAEANLAPIIGAFIAGIAIGRTRQQRGWSGTSA